MAAVTLALWGAVFQDDEARRMREAVEREQLVVDWLTASGCDPLVATSVWSTAVTTFRTAWLEHGHTPGIAYCLGEGLAAAGLFPDEGFDSLVGELESRALVELPPLVPGAREALAAIAKHWPVGVICDTRITPAPVLRDCMRSHSLTPFVDVAVFSDELGAAKPSRLPFRIAAEELGTAPSEIVHVGPSESRDVAGAAAVGAWSIHLGFGATAADAQCGQISEVAEAVRRLLAPAESR